MMTREIVVQERLHELAHRLDGEDAAIAREAAQIIAKHWMSLIHVRSVVKGALEP